MLWNNFKIINIEFDGIWPIKSITSPQFTLFSRLILLCISINTRNLPLEAKK